MNKEKVNHVIYLRQLAHQQSVKWGEVEQELITEMLEAIQMLTEEEFAAFEDFEVVKF